MQNQGFEQVTDFALHDFINNSNFEQFIDLIRGDPHTVNYDDAELMFGGGIVDGHFCPPPPPPDIFNFNSTTTTSDDPNSLLNSLPPFSGDIDIGDAENDDDQDDSSANTATPTKGTTAADRSRTLVSERRRRSRMKEKLYALRSLVPNITKMDKASIVGDAVAYVQDLQMQAKKIKAEIAGLEASLNGAGAGAGNFQGKLEHLATPNNVPAAIKTRICRKILQMDVFQVEEKEYYVRLVCIKGDGVAVGLQKALESLSSFDIKSSNFTTVSEKFVLTFTVDVKEFGEEMNLSTLKLWVTGALLNQGFEVKSP